MKVNFCTFSNSFKGNFFYTTDEHGRARGIAESFDIIEKEKSKELPNFLINGGDFSNGSPCSQNELIKLYRKFAKNNPDVKMIFQLGNTEFNSCNDKKLNSILTKLKKGLKNIGFINYTKEKLSKLYDKEEFQNVDEYVILNDKVKDKDGRIISQKILLTGTTDHPKITIDEHKKIFDEKIMPVINKEKPEKLMFIAHLKFMDRDNIKTFIENKNLPLQTIILSAHSHQSVCDIDNKKIKTVAPLAMGYGMIKMENRKDDIDIPKFKANGFNNFLDFYPKNFFKLDENPSISKYSKFLQKIGTLKTIGKLTVNPLGREEMNCKISNTSQIGTLLANKIKEETKSDFAVITSMSIRDRLPKAGNILTKYDVKKVIHENHNIDTMLLSGKDILNMFEESLKKQNEGISNGNFLEFSDNVKITRTINPNAEKKIKQIEIKGKKLLNDNGEIIDNNIKYKVSTCDYFSTGTRKGYEFLKGKICKHFKKYNLADSFVECIKDIIKSKQTTYPLSKIEDIN